MDRSSPQRINRYLALQLGISRREADELVEKGSVRVNDTQATLGSRVTQGDEVTVNNNPVSSSAKLIYLALHKPAGYVCSRKAQGDNPTIYELLPAKYHTLKPVGRLDKDSSGIILLTNDGDLAHQMTHPSFRKIKVYEVTLDKPLQPLHRQMISDYGVMLEDGKSQFEVTRMNDEDDLNWRITMSEGRNRQIRRTFTALGYTVTSLHRTHFGQYGLDGLTKGKYVELRISASSSRPTTSSPE